METFERKSAENSEAAKELIEKHKKYNASVHCSYYSCVQFMLHVLYARLKFYQLTTEEERRSKREHIINQSTERGWHNQLIETIRKRFPAKASLVAQFQFDSWIGDLKNQRQESDYFETMLDETQSKNILARSVEINSLLKKSFEL